MNAREITRALGGQWCGDHGRCRCPIHGSATLSLKVSDHPRRGIDVVCFANCGWKEIKDELRRQGLIGDGPLNVKAIDIPEPEPKPVDWSLWHNTEPLPGTLGEKYFVKTRKLNIKGHDLDHAIRYHNGQVMVVALMTHPVTNEPTGLHRTFLDTEGRKRGRMMAPGSRVGVVRVSPDEDVSYGLAITKGVEDALAILINGCGPVWAATSAGAINKFPVLAGIDCLTVFADNDSTGAKAAHTCKARWDEAGRETHVVTL